ncbi:cytochrome c oxidase assembly protein [Gordonia sp. CPCC 205515]|uniref:cytochrome c oxidase assembly protein n=1 Tax=Gordonia sp. CPCC 205515 TaxID=3140791 RepID=UPI003AF39526
MTAVDTPLTLATALSSWRLDPATLIVITVVSIGYALMWRRSTVPAYRAVLFLVVGCGVWLLSACSFVGVYSDVLFWVRSLQFVLILMVAPFGMALGMPVTVVRDALGSGRGRFDHCLHSRPARLLTSPLMTSAMLLVTPWLIYLTGWYSALLTNTAVDYATRILLVTIGFGYFYARLQLDPVPRRYPQSVSLIGSLVETLGDGVLGVVLWQGSIVAASYYAALGRDWGPSIRTDQTIGAGVFWILGDLVGLPFLMAVFARFRADEQVREVAEDADLDGASAKSAVASTEPTTLWWQSDPQLRERFHR